MLNIEEILKISDEMGVEVKEGTDNKHYIMDDQGEYIEFNAGMLISENKGNNLERTDLKVSNQFNVTITASTYKLSSYDAAYTSKPVLVNDSITTAA